jgi:hypothetical protein
MLHAPAFHLCYQFVVPFHNAPRLDAVVPDETGDASSPVDVGRDDMGLKMLAQQMLLAHYLRVDHPHPCHWDLSATTFGLLLYRFFETASNGIKISVPIVRPFPASASGGDSLFPTK